MSRTYRRNKPRKGLYRLSYHMINENDPHDWWTEHQMKRYGARTIDKLKQAIRAEFHGDTHSGRWNAPSWYRHQHSRPTKLANEAMIRKAIREDRYDSLSLIPLKSNAMYYWW